MPPKKTSPKADVKSLDEHKLLWEVMARVEKDAAGDLDASIHSFRKALRALDDAQLIEVEASFCALMRKAHNYRLWGAAYVIHGGCSDDTYWDFRAGLIALGRAVYDAALRDPDTLASIEDVEERTLFEGFQYVPGQELERRDLDSKGKGHHKRPPTGERWDDDELPVLYPKLYDRFG